MGIFDKVKAVGKEVGIGLNAQEQYQSSLWERCSASTAGLLLCCQTFFEG